MCSSRSLCLRRRARSTRSKRVEGVNAVAIEFKCLKFRIANFELRICSHVIWIQIGRANAIVDQTKSAIRNSKILNAFSHLREPTEVVISGASSFGRNHAGTNRRFGRAGGAKYFALPRLLDAFQDLAALTGLGIRNPQSRQAEGELSIKLRVLRVQFHATVRD